MTPELISVLADLDPETDPDALVCFFSHRDMLLAAAKREDVLREEVEAWRNSCVGHSHLGGTMSGCVACENPGRLAKARAATDAAPLGMCEEAAAEIARLREERDAADDLLGRFRAGMGAMCIYCGQSFPLDANRADLIRHREHECTADPMKARAEAAEARAGRLAEACREAIGRVDETGDAAYAVTPLHAALADAPKVLATGYYDDEHGVIMRASTDIGVPCIVIATTTQEER